jgi:hypothetical protein
MVAINLLLRSKFLKSSDQVADHAPASLMPGIFHVALKIAPL